MKYIYKYVVASVVIERRDCSIDIDARDHWIFRNFFFNKYTTTRVVCVICFRTSALEFLRENVMGPAKCWTFLKCSFVISCTIICADRYDCFWNLYTTTHIRRRVEKIYFPTVERVKDTFRRIYSHRILNLQHTRDKKKLLWPYWKPNAKHVTAMAGLTTCIFLSTFKQNHNYY